jgi:hypothetical protein
MCALLIDRTDFDVSFPKRKRPIDFHQSTFYVLVLMMGPGHVPRPRQALQGLPFESPRARCAGTLLVCPKRKRPIDFHQSTFYVLVPTEGLEPPHLAAHGPEPCASTNSATWALLRSDILVLFLVVSITYGVVPELFEGSAVALTSAR